MVIEAVTENEAVKKEVYQELAEVIRDDAILASNTSTISITRMAESAPHPERFVGMHFFNPVDRMELVEVIRGEKTSDETVATIVALAKRIRKTPIVVKDCAGLPGQSGALPVHERVADPACRTGRRWRRSTARPRSSACRWARSS